jgi:C-terminal processing protease CtpA/Prc
MEAKMSKLKIALSSCVIALALVFSSIAQAQFIFEELSTARNRINFPELTADEKRIVAEQAQVLLAGVYTNRFQKQEFYPGVTDPAIAIQAVVDNIDNLSVDEMEAQIYQIFASQRDLHLNYIFPQPYASSRAFLPLNFTRTRGFRNFFEVRVNSVNADQFAEFAPDQRVPEIGDQVISYNGVPVRTAVKNLLTVGQGANRFGGFNRAVARLTFAPQIVQLLPEEDEVTIKFRSAKRSKRGQPRHYSITMPWVTRTPEPVSANARFAPQATQDKKPAKLTRDHFLRGEDIYQNEHTKFLKENGLIPESMFPNNASNERVLTWGVIENRRGKFGYLNLSSFVPDSGVDATIEEIRRLIFEEFGETRGLIFDVRNNGGGFVNLADKLPQLFTRGDAVNGQARVLNTDTTLEIFNNSPFGIVFPELATALNDVAGTDATHSGLVPFNSSEEVNTLGQIYNGPVAVLANGNSYSASDLFTCQMQDSGAAFMFGEEPRTGAGGATVREHSQYAQFVPTAFEPLPATHRMRTAVLQGIRSGLNEGKFIEDFGCEADLVVSPVKSDLSDGGERQIQTITRALSYLSYFPRYRSGVRAPSNESLIFRGRGNLDFPLKVRNTPLIRVTVNGVVVDQQYGYGFGTRTIPVVFPDDLTTGTVNTVLIEGLSYYGTRKWNLKRQLVVLEEAITIDDTGFEIDFATEPATLPFSIINQNAPENGWNLAAPNLQVGFNPTYVDNVNTDALLLLDLSARESVELSFDMEYDTEVDFDFIEVFVSSPDGNRQTLLLDSGAQALQTFNFDLSEFAGQNGVQLHFRFTSDGGVVAPGVKLQRVSIR